MASLKRLEAEGYFVYVQSGGPLVIYGGPQFAESVRALLRRHGAKVQGSLANCNELAKRLSKGERLSTASFPSESGAYAFKSGRVRFYGAFAGSSFVLSHAILKDQQKLDQADRRRALTCRDRFQDLQGQE